MVYVGRTTPRLGRVVLTNYPLHVVQRGHNKNVVFAEDADYRYSLSTLEQFKPGFCADCDTHGEWTLIREALQRGQLKGAQRFVDEVEGIIGRRIENRKQGAAAKGG